MRMRRVFSFHVSSCLARLFCVAACGTSALAVQAQTSSPSTGAPALQTYTTPDRSAQAGVPPGWKVTKGAETVIVMDGPNGEEIALGNTWVTRNAAFQPNQPSANGIDVSIPNSASLAEKFTDLLVFASTQSHSAPPDVKIGSSAPLPITGLQCGRLTGTYTAHNGPIAFGVLLCSLPVDVGGVYKIMYKMAQAPPNIAAQEKALAGAVFASYRIPPAMIQKKFAPHFAPPPAPVAVGGGGAAGMSSAMNALRGADISSECMDLGVIREEPNWQLPRECGGLAPNP